MTLGHWSRSNAAKKIVGRSRKISSGTRDYLHTLNLLTGPRNRLCLSALLP
jgi:hypothetical protein